MNPWTVLGIEEGCDRRTIKRAYARLIKQHHPEEDPEGFQRVRAAYEKVLEQLEFFNWTETNGVQNTEHHEKPIMPAESEEVLVNPEVKVEISNEIAIEDESSPEESLSDLLHFVEEVLTSPALWSDIEIWKQIFASELLWHLDTKMEFTDTLFSMILYWREDAPSERYLSIDIWLYLEERCHWLDNELRLYQSPFSDEQIEYILGPIRNSLYRSQYKDIEIQNARPLASRSERNARYPIYISLFVVMAVFRLLINDRSHFENNDIEPYMDRFKYESNQELINIYEETTPSESDDSMSLPGVLDYLTKE